MDHIGYMNWIKHCIIVSTAMFLIVHSPISTKVICVHDVSSIYRVPLLLEEQGVVNFFCRRLDLPIEGRPRRMLAKWKEMSDRCVRHLRPGKVVVVVVVVGSPF